MAITLTLPSGVTTARAQVHPVLVTITGLTASSAFNLQCRYPTGTVGSTGSLARFQELTFNSDASGTASMTLLPTDAGTYTVVVVPNPSRFENTIGPAMGSVVANDTATFTTTLTVGS